MKRLYFFVSVILFSQICSAEESPTLLGECYQAVMKYESPKDENILTVCLSQGKVVERMFFSNQGKMPAVCYQSGVVNDMKNNQIKLSYINGYCDNGRPYQNPPLTCTKNINSSLDCKDEYGSVILDYVGIVK